MVEDAIDGGGMRNFGDEVGAYCASWGGFCRSALCNFRPVAGKAGLVGRCGRGERSMLQRDEAGMREWQKQWWLVENAKMQLEVGCAGIGVCLSLMHTFALLLCNVWSRTLSSKLSMVVSRCDGWKVKVNDLVRTQGGHK